MVTDRQGADAESPTAMEAFLHEFCVSEILYLFGSGNCDSAGCPDPLTPLRRRRSNICLYFFLGGLRDKKDAEFSALLSACLFMKVPLVGF